MSIDKMKNAALRHFEGFVVLSTFCGVLLMNFFVVQKASFLHFYFLPSLVAGYVLGRRMAVFTSILSIGFVVLFIAISGARFSLGETPLDTAVTIALWGGFLMLTSYVVGSLYEQNAEKMRHLKHAYVGVLEILSKYIESRDRHTLGHSMRVSRFAAEIAKEMRLPPAKVENCRVAGLLHDIGKVELSMNLIRKAAALSDEERDDIATQAKTGARMIDSMGDILKDVVPIIEDQPTHYRGSGDSDGAGPPIEAFIITVADAYDVLVTDGPFRAGKPSYLAIAELEKCAGREFHPDVVAAMKKVSARRVEIELGVPVDTLAID